MSFARFYKGLALLVMLILLAVSILPVKSYAEPAAEILAPVAGGSSVVCPAWKTITIDGTNDFPASAYITEVPFASPTAGGSATQSDMPSETAAYHWTNGWTDQPLSGGSTADIRDFWVTWDANYLYLAVKGPNAMMDTDLVDLFVAIDTNGSQSGDLGQSQVPWSKWVDFDEWSPEYFIAVANARDVTGDNNPAGYAELVPAGGSGTALTWGSAWSNSGWASDGSGGVFFEFRLTWAQLGQSGPPNWNTTGTPMNFAIYTTYNNSGFDAYDSAPGTGNGSTYEQIGDFKGDADHCSGNLDPVTGAGDLTCSYGESDGNNGPGNAVGGRFPGSDDADGGKETPDTIGEYYRITNVGELNQIGDLIYADLNENSVFDSGDQPMGSGVTVNLTGAATATATTAAGGLYSFDKLTCGTFTVTADSSTLPAPGTFGAYIGPWIATQNAGGYGKTFNIGPESSGRAASPQAVDLNADFGFKPSGPLAATLANFAAQQQAEQVLLTWETTTELNNRGFNLYRGTTPDAWDRQLNVTLIPSQAQGTSSGFIYTWTDSTDLATGQFYSYWLQTVDVNGVTVTHGPTTLVFAAPTAVQVRDLTTGTQTGNALAWIIVIALASLAAFLLTHAGRNRMFR
ncbi:MAG: SdrD B-like domain-containing protein [Anaerolineae bacterium]